MAMAFERCNIATLFAQTADRNRSSWRIMEKLGMHRHRALDYDDPRFETRDNPTIIYRLTQADWRAARAA
jgi:RimJ/RimL family protein N-acetyltransferase